MIFRRRRPQPQPVPTPQAEPVSELAEADQERLRKWISGFAVRRPSNGVFQQWIVDEVGPIPIDTPAAYTHAAHLSQRKVNGAWEGARYTAGTAHELADIHKAEYWESVTSWLHSLAENWHQEELARATAARERAAADHATRAQRDEADRLRAAQRRAVVVGIEDLLAEVRESGKGVGRASAELLAYLDTLGPELADLDVDARGS